MCLLEMNNVLEIEMTLNRKKYPYIYNSFIVLLIMIVVLFLIFGFYEYKSYYVIKGKSLDNSIEMIILEDDISFVNQKGILYIDDKKYNYKLKSISDKVIFDESYNKYVYVYLDVFGVTYFNNYVYELKFEKERKKIIKYFKEVLWN